MAAHQRIGNWRHGLRTCLLALALGPAHAIAGLSIGASAVSPEDTNRLYARFDALPAPACSGDEKGEVRALLVGIQEYAIAAVSLAGAVNDVDLLERTLQRRGLSGDRIKRLAGKVDKRMLVDALYTLAQSARCNDSILIHWSGTGVEGERGYPVLLTSDTRGLSGTRVDAASAITTPELRRMVTAIRNRGASVFLSLDTCFAGSLRLAERSDARTWRWPALADAGGEATQRASAGEFSGFYASLIETPELQMPPGDRNARIYGLYSFILATSLGRADAMSYRQLSELMRDGYRSYEQQAKVGERVAVPVFEATQPDARVLAASTTASSEAPSRGARMELLSPAPMRGLTPANDRRIKVEARVVPADGLVAAFVNSTPARIGKDGHFTADIDLPVGRSRVFVNAVVGRNDVVQQTFEIVRQSGAGAPADGGTRYALVIGNAAYQDKKFSDLVTPIADADAVARALRERYGFVTELKNASGATQSLVLHNATRRAITSALSRLRGLVTENDSVLIYYAGHGWRNKEIDQAYWLPVDSERDDFGTWLSASDITDQIRLMNARHVLVVSDSCYSGALLRSGTDATTQPPQDRDRQRVLEQLHHRRSRILIASGSDEPVTDGGGGGHSVFARAFLNALERADENGSASAELFTRHIQQSVVGQSRQSPQHRPLTNSGHDGGDFVFWRAGGSR